MLPFEHLALRLVAALLLGALIGVERQYRQRSAGLRTNALVGLGAATFALLGLSIAGDSSPTRMAAQVISGISFLGAGAILREGLTVKGLNTAATLWCSAAVGVACGAGMFAVALLAAALVVVVNIVIRPLVLAIDSAPQSGAEAERAFRITVAGATDNQAALRLLLVKQIALAGMRLRQLHSEDAAGGLVLTAGVVAGAAAEQHLETIVGRLSVEPTVTRTGWSEEE